MQIFTLQDVYRAAWLWYGKHDRDYACLAENRLMRGEKPDNFYKYPHTQAKE